MKVYALYDYTANENDELTLRKGDIVELLETYDDGWSRLLNSANINGLVPSNYFKVAQEQQPKPLRERETKNKADGLNYHISMAFKIFTLVLSELQIRSSRKKAT